MPEYNKVLGSNLREARKSTGMSLAGVASFTGGEFKGSVLGAYERGERAITVKRLDRLCTIYGVHTASVMPYTGSVLQ